MAPRSIDLSNHEIAPHDDDWRLMAECRELGPSIFYSDNAERKARAKQFCGQCVVRDVCLESAIRNRERHGIWGGLEPDERQKEIRRRQTLRRRAGL